MQYTSQIIGNTIPVNRKIPLQIQQNFGRIPVAIDSRHFVKCRVKQLN